MSDTFVTGKILPGTFVAGFEGVVEARATPARRAPVLLDERRHRVLVRPTGDRWSVDVASTPFGSSAHAEWTPLPESARWPARAGHPVVLIGEDEQRNAEVIRARVIGEEERLFAGWLLDGIVPPGLAAVHAEQLGVWYPSREAADELTRVISGIARERQLRSVAEGDLKTLRWASWWLQRSGMDHGDQLRAAAGLKLAGERDAIDVLRAMVPSLRRAGADEALRRAVEDLQSAARGSGLRAGPRGRDAFEAARIRMRFPRAA